MLVPMLTLLETARAGGYAVGAFNIYNLEGTLAVMRAAEAERSPVIVQVLPSAIQYGGVPLLALCLSAAREATIPACVHLDHCPTLDLIHTSLDAGVTSVMADGSHLPYANNVAFSASVVAAAHARGAVVEAELGKLGGSEDSLIIHEREARMTDPAQVAGYLAQTDADTLAVCIGNVHGVYASEPRLDFERLAAIRQQTDAPLVLHGASGLPEDQIHHSIDLGITKFNVNTEVRAAYVDALREGTAHGDKDLLDFTARAVSRMQDVVVSKLRLFRSAQRA
ncbi:MAG: class II fructose-bisphosphate aldolase [Anaerolineae bacterium]|nr:class II fructose-bisphosphate aldolase [Anaerolineae bacterium]